MILSIYFIPIVLKEKSARESRINPNEPSGTLNQPTFFQNSDSICQ